MDDDQSDIIGVWSGSAPTCERKLFRAFELKQFLDKFLFIL